MTSHRPAESPPPDRIELDPTRAQRHELLRLVSRHLDEFFESLAAQPAWANEGGEAIARRLDEPVPEEPSPPDEVLRLLFDEVIPRALNTASPGYLAYVPGGGLFSAAVGDLIASAVNRYSGLWTAAPGAVEIESRAVRWLAAAMGLGPGFDGVLTTGGSVSNLLALAAARDHHLAGDPTRGTVYVSEETHHSVAKAAHVAGIPRQNVRTVAVDDALRLRVDRLEEAVEEDRRRGLQPFFVSSTAGTVASGAVDPIAEIGALAAREGLWHHVDGAYGGTFALVPELRETLRGMEHADSIAVDPHKGLFLAYGTGALLVRDLARLHAAFGSEASYLPPFQDETERVDFCEVSPELSRPWRGLRLWLPFRLHGLAVFRDALRERRRLALLAFEAIGADPDVEFAAPPELSLFAFRRRWPERERAEENRRNRRLLERINEPRRVYLTGTEIGGLFFLRVCVLHLRTDEARIREGLEIIRRALEDARGW